MPEKYVIHTDPVPNRFKPVAKTGVIAWEEGCLRCAVCVKQKCVYDVYYKRGLDPRHMTDSIDNLCMNCFRCVQGCPKELIHKSVNPEFKAMGDSFFTPEIIAKLWYQAETGKIPVSGAGYPGPFCGPGFDSMWTDMSEIVRPTRDGIHGREYISTAVDLGRTPKHLIFDREGRLTEDIQTFVDIPMPILFRIPPYGAVTEKTILGWARAARQLETLMALPQKSIRAIPDEITPWLIPILEPDSTDMGVIPKEVRIVEVPWTERCEKNVIRIKEAAPSILLCVRIPMADGMEEKAVSLGDAGVEIIYLEGGPDTQYDAPRVKEGIRSVHLRLVEAGIRDEMTLLASGGFAMAEHVAKGIICGADAVFTDMQLLIAMQCRMCRRCTKELNCPVELGDASSKWAAARVVNLFGAWHNQLLEVMGAMGIREARRLRGEVGRAMFYEDLDETTFGSLGSFEEGCELE